MQCPGCVIDRVLSAYFHEPCVLTGELSLPPLLNVPLLTSDCPPRVTQWK